MCYAADARFPPQWVQMCVGIFMYYNRHRTNFKDLMREEIWVLHMHLINRNDDGDLPHRLL